MNCLLNLEFMHTCFSRKAPEIWFNKTEMRHKGRRDGSKKYLRKIQFYVFVYLDEVSPVYNRHINMYAAEWGIPRKCISPTTRPSHLPSNVSLKDL